MPNKFRYNTPRTEPNCLFKGLWAIDISSPNTGGGPTSSTNLYGGANIPAGGYTFYTASNVFTAQNDAQLLTKVNQLGSDGSSINAALSFLSTQPSIIVLDKDFENIVTDGLALYLDAGAVPSYPRNGTTWYDLGSGANNGTLVNEPAFNTANGGSISFDGGDDYATANLPSSFLGNPIFSIGGWFKRSGTWNSGATWGIGNGGTNINTYCWSYDNTIGLDLYGNTTFNTFETYSLTEWKYIVWTYNGSTFTNTNVIIYINGVPYTGNNLSVIRGGSGSIPNVIGSSLALGRVSSNENQYYGKPIIGNFQMYNRVLSQTEITQNFNAQKTRFGL